MLYFLDSLHSTGSVLSEDCITSHSMGPGEVSRLTNTWMSVVEVLTVLTIPKASFMTSSTSPCSRVDWDVTCRFIRVAHLVRRRSPSEDLRDVALDRCFFLTGPFFSCGVGMSMWGGAGCLGGDWSGLVKNLVLEVAGVGGGGGKMLGRGVGGAKVVCDVGAV